MLIKSVKAFDLDQDGLIPIEEFKFFLLNFGEVMKDDEQEKLLKLCEPLDANDNVVVETFI